MGAHKLALVFNWETCSIRILTMIADMSPNHHLGHPQWASFDITNYGAARRESYVACLG